jgi:hypothetical protein
LRWCGKTVAKVPSPTTQNQTARNHPTRAGKFAQIADSHPPNSSGDQPIRSKNRRPQAITAHTGLHGELMARDGFSPGRVRIKAFRC